MLEVWLVTAQIEWLEPWALLLAPLPLLVRLLPVWHETTASIRVPFFERLLRASGARPRPGAARLEKTGLQKTWLVLCWLALVIAAAHPRWIGEPITQQRTARDLMVAVDLSGSMETRDFQTPNGERIDRLNALKAVLETLSNARPGDRLGLIVFGSGAYLQAPFTADHATWRALLRETRPRMAGPSTMMGDAIGLAIKLFTDSESQHRVLLLLTDGNDTGSIVPPIDAARVAASRGIRIYPIAIGDPASVGEEAIDTDTLERIANVTGGQSLVALDHDALDRVIDVLEALEPTLFDTVSFRPRTDIHWLPVALVLLLYPLLRGLQYTLSHRHRRSSA